MKKITDLTEKRFRTSYVKDALGNRKRVTEEYTAKRPVRTVNAGPRFGHFIIDIMCYQIIATAVGFVFQFFSILAGAEETVQLTVAFYSGITTLLLYPAFYFFCEYFFQKTPGKLLTRTVVIDEYGKKPELGPSLLRSLLRVVPFEAFSCLGDNSHGWHDSWSNTYVVKESELQKIRELQAEQTL